MLAVNPWALEWSDRAPPGFTALDCTGGREALRTALRARACARARDRAKRAPPAKARAPPHHWRHHRGLVEDERLERLRAGGLGGAVIHHLLNGTGGGAGFAAFKRSAARRPPPFQLTTAASGGLACRPSACPGQGRH